MSRDPFPSAPDNRDPEDFTPIPRHHDNSADTREHSVRNARELSGESKSGSLENARPGLQADGVARAYHLRDRTYLLRESEFTTLVEIGKFRVVEAADLVEFGYAGDDARMSRDIRRLEQQGLVVRKSLKGAGGRTDSLLVLKRKAKCLVLQSGRLPEGQAIYQGLVKAREARHDAALYRLYWRESARIESEGGRPVRIALDYELKRNLHRELAQLKDQGQIRAAREGIAEKQGLVVIDDKVQIPDLRLEYETADFQHKHVDLELATRNYRPRALTQKAKAGFSIYSPRDDASKLRRILGATELTARILAL
jgi:hypothetical protein